MDETKFQELVRLREESYKETSEYLGKRFVYISLLESYARNYFGCPPSTPSNIKVVSPLAEKEVTESGNSPPYVEVDEDQFFNFGFQIDLHHPDETSPGFNINNSGKRCGKSFSEKGLIPFSSVIFHIGIKKEESDDMFTLVFWDHSNKQPQERFIVNSKQEGTFDEVFKFIYEETKDILKIGTEGRIKALKTSQESGKQPLGFAVSAISPS